VIVDDNKSAVAQHISRVLEKRKSKDYNFELLSENLGIRPGNFPFVGCKTTILG
jgi:hypothetical protein